VIRLAQILSVFGYGFGDVLFLVHQPVAGAASFVLASVALAIAGLETLSERASQPRPRRQGCGCGRCVSS
jgi:hypothetical protein